MSVSTASGSTRVTSAGIVTAVIHEGRSLSQVAPLALRGVETERDRAFVQASAYGVLRHYHALKSRLATLMKKPLRHKDADLEALLLVGLYQLEHMGVANHAAVSATVDGARALDKEWACRLVNGVLRAALRNPPAVNAASSAQLEYPPWMIDHIRRDWPHDWQSILVQSNAQAPLTLRVNCQQSTRAEYIALLEAANLDYRAGTHARAALRLLEPLAVSALPRFGEGYVSVQDEAAQLAAELLAPRAGERVLDACAAPGGKTAHLLELGGADIALVAVESSASRLTRIGENLARLALRCVIVHADAGAPHSWWDGHRFDKILLDAPCSALGVMRRHPDIRLRRSPADVTNLVKEQQRLLHALWPLLADGGRLLYATCSILRAENDDVISTLLDVHADARVLALPLTAGRATRHGRQILPGDDHMDGFYYCLLSKQAAV